VTLEQDTQRITLSVEYLSPLNVVFAEFCMETRAICEGIQQTDSIVVPGQHFSGSWYEVISHLLEGAGLNYVVIAPSVSSGRTLKILGIASDSESGRRNVSATASSAPNSNRQLVAPESSNDGSQASATAGDRRGVRPSAIEAIQDSAEAANNDFSPASGSASITSSSPESGPGYLLFPDGNGNPIPTAERKTEFLVFPDSRGNPIPVSISGPPLYLLFPNSHGQPMPVSLSGQPPQYLLFPDSGGNPIPVQQPPQP
jgi:hypothetical protein